MVSLSIALTCLTWMVLVRASRVRRPGIDRGRLASIASRSVAWLPAVGVVGFALLVATAWNQSGEFPRSPRYRFLTTEVIGGIHPGEMGRLREFVGLLLVSSLATLPVQPALLILDREPAGPIRWRLFFVWSLGLAFVTGLVLGNPWRLWGWFLD